MTPGDATGPRAGIMPPRGPVVPPVGMAGNTGPPDRRAACWPLQGPGAGVGPPGPAGIAGTAGRHAGPYRAGWHDGWPRARRWPDARGRGAVWPAGSRGPFGWAGGHWWPPRAAVGPRVAAGPDLWPPVPWQDGRVLAGSSAGRPPLVCSGPGGPPWHPAGSTALYGLAWPQWQLTARRRALTAATTQGRGAAGLPAGAALRGGGVHRPGRRPAWRGRCRAPAGGGRRPAGTSPPDCTKHCLVGGMCDTPSGRGPSKIRDHEDRFCCIKVGFAVSTFGD